MVLGLHGPILQGTGEKWGTFTNNGFSHYSTLKLLQVIFSDEKKWMLDGPDSNGGYWWDLRKDTIHFKKRAFGGGNVMVWGDFSEQWCLQLVLVSSKMKSSDYMRGLGRKFGVLSSRQSWGRMDVSAWQCSHSCKSRVFDLVSEQGNTTFNMTCLFSRPKSNGKPFGEYSLIEYAKTTSSIIL